MRNDFSHVSSNFAENLMSKHEYACYGNTSCCFWDGKSQGTKHMIEIAKEKDIPVWIYKPQIRNL